MAFQPYLNGFVADTTDRRLRVRLGYIKMKNIGQTGLPGYLRSVGMTQRNKRECASRAAVRNARRTAANNDEPVGRSHQNALFYLRTKEVAMVASRLAECVRRGPAAGACGVRFFF